jgi:hypothetical protein
MIPTMPALGIRFVIGKFDDDEDSYGTACWKIFWGTIRPDSLGTALLFEGDTEGTPSRENVYCLAIQSNDSRVLETVKATLAASPAFRDVAASPMFVEGDACRREPLPEAGKVSAAGRLVDANEWTCGAALAEVRRLG